MQTLSGIERRASRSVRAGDVTIGGGRPVVIQEMIFAPASDVDRATEQIGRLQDIGLRLVRVAVPDMESAAALKEIKKRTRIPIVCDVHFDHRIAIAAIEAGCDKLRINPGNIGSERKVREVVRAAKERGVPIRIGVNAGSLQKEVTEEFGGRTAAAMVSSGLREVALLERCGFFDIVLSLKSKDVALTIAANREAAKKTDYPLHLGITEAGFGQEGVLRSVCGLTPLLAEGIGDTVRISLTEKDRTISVRLCRRILSSLHIPWV
ncbi:MAG: flavodoxin-dependent (E)-4-hydroxy-3-methylbut-2-enyl-diphosphate synthase [Spirochaetes bacterium]|nr:flavodoxin-dependent (E)-4-hydroxy-3-methylbut-2-enyl-diphosphate synthase [Spirochaetota bacterium]